MRTFGLIGFPLVHSFSQKYFTEKFHLNNITDAEYKLFPIDKVDSFLALLKKNPNLIGLNVTIPYKEQIIPLLDLLDETAKKTGAVNCIKITRTSSASFTCTGYNTDSYGFSQSIKPFLENHHHRALILGTGGASKAVEYVLKNLGIDVCKVTRTKKINAVQQFTYSELTKNIIEAFTLIVNSTPLGTFPKTDEFPPIPYEYLTSKHLLYDLVYNPTETNFLRKGKEKSCTAINGLNMLYLQADKAWEIWNQTQAGITDKALI